MHAARLAFGLWVALALVVWNVVFDRVLVVAGRQYVYSATRAARAAEPYLRVDDWMRPAVSRAVRTANGAAALTLAIGAAGLVIAPRLASRDLAQTASGTRS